MEIKNPDFIHKNDGLSWPLALTNLWRLLSTWKSPQALKVPKLQIGGGWRSIQGKSFIHLPVRLHFRCLVLPAVEDRILASDHQSETGLLLFLFSYAFKNLPLYCVYCLSHWEILLTLETIQRKQKKLYSNVLAKSKIFNGFLCVCVAKKRN